MKRRISIENELQEIIDYVMKGEASDRLSELDSRHDRHTVRLAFINFLPWLKLRATVHQSAETFPGESYPGHKRLSEKLHQPIFEVLNDYLRAEKPLCSLFDVDETAMEVKYSEHVDQSTKQQVQDFVKKNYKLQLRT